MEFRDSDIYWISIGLVMIIFMVMSYIVFGIGHPTEGSPTGQRFIMVLIAWLSSGVLLLGGGLLRNRIHG